MCWQCAVDAIPYTRKKRPHVATAVLSLLEAYGPVIDVAVCGSVDVDELGAQLAKEGVFLREWGAQAHEGIDADRTTEAA